MPWSTQKIEADSVSAPSEVVPVSEKRRKSGEMNLVPVVVVKNINAVVDLGNNQFIYNTLFKHYRKSLDSTLV